MDQVIFPSKKALEYCNDEAEAFIQRIWSDCSNPGCFTQLAVLVEFSRSIVGLETVESIALKSARPPDEIQHCLDHFVQVGLVSKLGVYRNKMYYTLTSDPIWMVQLTAFMQCCFASRATLLHFYHRLHVL